MKLRSNARRIILIPLFIGAILFVYTRTATKFYGQVLVELDDKAYSFMSQTDIASMISNRNGVKLNTMKLRDLSLRNIEEKVRAYHFVADCEVSRDLKGNVLVKIEQNYPIARILGQNSTRKGGYLSKQGEILPLSNNHTARTLLVSGKGTENILNGHFLETEEGLHFIHLLSYIHENPFWKAQITHIEINKKGRLKLFTQVGTQTILFGRSENFQHKLEKLNLFYERVIPQQGWNRYKIINLEFEDQIVCS